MQTLTKISIRGDYLCKAYFRQRMKKHPLPPGPSHAYRGQSLGSQKYLSGYGRLGHYGLGKIGQTAGVSSSGRALAFILFLIGPRRACKSKARALGYCTAITFIFPFIN